MQEFKHASGICQRVAIADLADGGSETFKRLLHGKRVGVVYSDPPWSPGNEKWWRRYGGHNPPEDYTNLLRGWCACVVAANPEHVFVEQSIIDAHCKLLLDVIGSFPGWPWELMGRWVVQYGNPLRPNVLLHFGPTRCTTDPGGMHGDAMTRHALKGVPVTGAIADPCTGLGMSSRMAHEFGVDFIGTELTPKRLDKTVQWLLKKGT